MSSTKYLVDQMLEDTIMRMLVQGNKMDMRKELENVVDCLRKTAETVNNRVVGSVQGLQEIYEKELEIYKAILPSIEGGKNTEWMWFST